MSLRQINPKPLKRGPFAIDGLVLSGLGRVIEWEMSNGAVIRAGRNTHMAWSPDRKALILLEGAKWGKPSKSAWDHVVAEAKGRKALKKFEAWADRQAKAARAVKISTRIEPKWYTTTLSVVRLDYASDKWGQNAEYTHDFGKGVRLYLRQSSLKGPAVWVIKGGRMTVTEKGIVN